MKSNLTRIALAFTALYWAGGLVFAIASAALEPNTGFLTFTWDELALIVALIFSLPLTIALWIGFALAKFVPRAWTTAAFAVYGAALPILYFAALALPGLVERAWHARQLAMARISSLSDEPFFGALGHPIGVRLTYRVVFPWGLSSLGQEPPADAPTADVFFDFPNRPSMDFATRASSLREAARAGFPKGSSAIVVDFVPPFLPLAFQTPLSFPASDPRNLCFRWTSATARAAALGTGAKALSIAINPLNHYRLPGSPSTTRAYALSDFYEGAKAEGAVECR